MYIVLYVAECKNNVLSSDTKCNLMYWPFIVYVKES